MYVPAFSLVEKTSNPPNPKWVSLEKYKVPSEATKGNTSVPVVLILVTACGVPKEPLLTLTL